MGFKPEPGRKMKVVVRVVSANELETRLQNALNDGWEVVHMQADPKNIDDSCISVLCVMAKDDGPAA